MRICSIEGCEGSHAAGGFCNKHYHKYVRYGDPLYINPRYLHPKICKIAQCNQESRSEGLCQRHLRSLKKYGDPLYVDRKKLENNHNMHNTSEYRTYYAMIQRCINPNNVSYKDYGGRGITVCDHWLYSFNNFYKDMGKKPFPKAEIDRKRNSKGYCKDNCRWTTQTINRRHTRRVKLSMKKAREIRSSNLPRKELALKMGVCLTTIRYVINNKTWKEGV